jgi:hypothetical protein
VLSLNQLPISRVVEFKHHLPAAEDNEVRIFSDDKVDNLLLTEVGQLGVGLVRCHYTFHSCTATLLDEGEGHFRRDVHALLEAVDGLRSLPLSQQSLSLVTVHSSPLSAFFLGFLLEWKVATVKYHHWCDVIVPQHVNPLHTVLDEWSVGNIIT